MARGEAPRSGGSRPAGLGEGVHLKKNRGRGQEHGPAGVGRGELTFPAAATRPASPAPPHQAEQGADTLPTPRHGAGVSEYLWDVRLSPRRPAPRRAEPGRARASQAEPGP